MLYKTRGIVFRFTKYGETSIIVNIFTELFGLQSYIVNGARTKSVKSRMALYQPFTFLDMIVYHRENASINRIKEVKCLQPFQSLILDIKKSVIIMFINEVVNKTVREDSHSQEMFDFLLSSITALDKAQNGYENFHLTFLLKLSRLLGFGAHTINEVIAGRAASDEIEKLVGRLIEVDYVTTVNVTNSQRRILLDLLLGFYADHVENLGEIKSVKVLQELMN